MNIAKVGDRITYFANTPEAKVEKTHGLWLPATVIEVRETKNAQVVLAMPDHRVIGNPKPEGAEPFYGVALLVDNWVPGAEPVKFRELSSRPDEAYEQLMSNTTEQLIAGVSYIIKALKLPVYKWPSPNYRRYNTERQRDRMLCWLVGKPYDSEILRDGGPGPFPNHGLLQDAAGQGVIIIRDSPVDYPSR